MGGMIRNAFIRLVSGAGILGLAFGCASAAAPVIVPGTGEATITRGALRAIEARWRDVELGRPPASACAGTAETSAPLVRGDFNGDGLEDVALWIAAEGTPHLVAALAMLDGRATVVEVGDGATLDGVAALEIGPRGTAYRTSSLTIDFFYGADTVVTRACDGSRTAWFWTGGSFGRQSLAS